MTTGPVGACGWLVFGLGHPDRGDDAVGPAVVEQVAQHVARPIARHMARHIAWHPDEQAPGGIRTGWGVEPLGLLDLLRPGDGLVLVDAVRTGSAAGTVLVRDLVADPLPATGSPASGHLLGLDQVLALARSVDRLTGPVRLVGVEAGHFEHGAGLSAAVAAAVPTAVGAVLGVLGPEVPAAGRIGGCRSTIASSPAPSSPGG